jgi:hypothetical protein
MWDFVPTALPLHAVMDKEIDELVKEAGGNHEKKGE